MSDELDKELGCIIMILLILFLIFAGLYLNYQSCETMSTITGVEHTWGPLDGCEIKK